MQIERIFQEIVNDINRCWMNTKGGNDVWTKNTFQELERIGCGYSWKSKYSGTGNSEWLWDFVWQDRDSEGNLKQIILAAESEWTYKNTREDFEKLLASIAPMRFFIFQVDKLFKRDEKISEFISVTEKMSVNPGHYLIACWNYGPENSGASFGNWNTHILPATIQYMQPTQ